MCRLQLLPRPAIPRRTTPSSHAPRPNQLGREDPNLQRGLLAVSCTRLAGLLVQIDAPNSTRTKAMGIRLAVGARFA
jgi:hypothetical protein